MARGRMLSRTLGSSRRFNALHDFQNSEFTQLLFALLIPHADDFGRMVGDSYTVKLQVFPGSARSNAEFADALHSMHDVELVTVYAVERDIWLQVNKFEEHQRGLSHRTASRIPPPNGDDCRKFPQMGEKIPSRARAEENLTKENLREEKILVPGAGGSLKGGVEGNFLNGNGNGGGSTTTTTRSRRPIYQSDRFVVFDWMLDDLTRLLGPHTEGFDLHAFFDGLSQQSRASGLVIPQHDKGVWLHAQVLAEAQRRGLPIAIVTVPSKQAQKFAGILKNLREKP